ncbi:MAG: anaerobic ribonucleoside-triphosphate reductase activating protein [candidate division WOR-3 bacterium]|nr:MAG: anaerobic ribonucleoside-triphosphate reductase activating protein [candidate division WOR-3 bacterium]
MIRSIIETSLIDWDGKLTTVLFFDKCNFMCPFCQNWELLKHPEKFPVVEWSKIEKMLLSKRSWIDGVVLTGGEPLVNKKEVFDITSRIKRLGFLVKIDTNGAYPQVLCELIEKSLVDYVAMDIKAPIDKRYANAVGTKIDLMALEATISMLLSGQTEYEFRTTCVPRIIDIRSIEEIGMRIKGAERWFLQQYVPVNAYDEEYRKMSEVSKKDANTMLTIARKYVADVRWRGKQPD